MATSQNIDIPIGNLWLKGKPVKIGHVTFIAITEQEIIEWKKSLQPLPKKPDVHVVARVNAPGDLEKAASYTKNQVNLTLNIIRALCFPFGKKSESWKVGIIGDYIFPASTPIRINGKMNSFLVPPSTGILELKSDILRHLQQSQLELINKLILKQENSCSAMEIKLLNSIHWLAESTKPDTTTSKFVKISIALENLLGSEAKRDENLQVRGITAMLAERAAFIADNRLDYMLTIDKNIRKYYRKRSSIVHGDITAVPLNDIDKFGELVRQLVLALLEKLDKLGDKIRNVDDLAKWIKEQKYTLPEHSSKEVT